MTDGKRADRYRRQKGRVEAALDLDLRQHTDLAHAVRASLRDLAALLDQAEKAGDLDAGARVAHEFHAQLAAAGIATPPVERVDTLEDFLRATANPRHTEDA